MAVVFLTPVNTLAHRLGRGLSREDAVARAQANVEAMRDDGMAEIDRNLAELQALFASFRTDSGATAGPIYDVANTLGGLAPVFGLSAVGAIANSLCDYLCTFEDAAAINAEVVRTHLDGLPVLRNQTELGETETRKIVEQLTAMVRRLTARAAGAAER